MYGRIKLIQFKIPSVVKLPESTSCTADYPPKLHDVLREAIKKVRHCRSGKQKSQRTPAYQPASRPGPEHGGRFSAIPRGARGTCYKARRDAYSRLLNHATDLLGVLSALALHDVVFVGHSVAAMIGVIAAVREPQRFAKMVLISPSPRFINEKGYAGGFEQQDINELLGAMESDYRGWSQGFAPVMMSQHERPELVLELTNSFLRTNPAIAKHFARVTFFSDTRTELGFLTIPTLIVQSAHDVIAPLAVGHYLQEQLADSRLVVVATNGHCPHLSAPRETLAALDAFLAEGN